MSMTSSYSSEGVTCKILFQKHNHFLQVLRIYHAHAATEVPSRKGFYAIFFCL